MLVVRSFGLGGWALISWLWMAAGGVQPAAQAAEEKTSETSSLVEMEGKVEVARSGSPAWDPAYAGQALYPGDLLRTGERSRAVVRLSPLTTLRVDELTLLRVPSGPKKRGILRLLRGVIYFFHRDKPEDFPVETPTMWAVIRGTDFNLRVETNGASTLTMLAGEVEMTNQFGRVSLQNGEAGIARPGQPPRETAVLRSDVVNTIQWCLYYPGVLDPDDLRLSAAEQEALTESLRAYRSGDLPAALAAYPAGRQPASLDEKIYRAALALSAGGVTEAEAILGSLGERAASNRLAALEEALRLVIAAVKFQERPPLVVPRTDSPLEPPDHPLTRPEGTDLSTALLAESYYRQSRSELDRALIAAHNATQVSSEFGFAWARVAELEFGSGRVPEARDALEKALQFSPRNAQAVAMRGFVLAAQNQTAAAIRAFDEAILLDGGLGNAWLGRGLCRIHRGEEEEGRQDLQVAATVEPQRALFRSYLGKAFSHGGDNARAVRELALAGRLDPQDPTAWLYLALVRQQQNRINQAIRDLEISRELNDNRSVYRPRLLLDHDQSVRGANLAGIYLDAGMTDVSFREAARAVSLDYANYSAHLFLADSYNALRDPSQINLRYETPWLSEYLVANLLAPVQAGTLSPFVTQQDYARLFERNRLGLSSRTDYLSRGAWFQTAVQYGIWDDFAYAAEVAYRSDPGQRVNEDLDQLTATLKFKEQISLHDSVFLQATTYRATSGDLRRFYHPAMADPDLRVKETQEPFLLAGYHHRWSPGIDTLFLSGWLQDTLRYSTPRQPTLLLEKDAAGRVTSVLPAAIGQDYRSEVDVFGAELQQIVQRDPHTVVLGGRFQTGCFEAENRTTITNGMVVNPSGFEIPARWFDTTAQDFSPDFQRLSFYGYYHWHVVEPLVLIGGVSYDRLTHPVNFRFAPLAPEEETADRISPKAGVVWTPQPGTTLRAAYTRSLGGVAYDQSFRLEPSQVAGFSQAFRSLIPESVAGANSAARFETWGIALDQTFPGGTYLGVSGEWLGSDVHRVFGTFDLPSPLPSVEPFLTPSGTRESLDYRERSLFITLNQLLSDEWSLGARYRLSYAELGDDFRDIPDAAATAFGFRPRQELEGVLHQVNLFAIYNHPSGFFGQIESLWSRQSNHGYSPALPGDDFWQVNVHVGYRFWQRRAEARVGVLNLTDRDYRLNPLNLTPELPRSRTLLVSFRFHF